MGEMAGTRKENFTWDGYKRINTLPRLLQLKDKLIDRNGLSILIV